MMTHSYTEQTGRNIGFVTEAQQEQLRLSTVYICGVGGMGGACALALARAGVGRLVMADIDVFEASNLNRQVFAFTDTLGQHKAEATAAVCARINPHGHFEVRDATWPEQLAEDVLHAGAVVNGADDLAAGLHLYRTAQAFKKTVIDAYAAPLPSVYVTTATDAPPEERLGYPTRGTAWDAITPAQRTVSFQRELEHVLLHSSSRRWIDMDVAAQVAAGTRPRMSWAPMVITTGQMMAYEVLHALLDQPHGTDARGYFFNPHTGRTERPYPTPVAALLRPFVRRALRRMVERA
jgi:molybdopterin-synthase adenylyltransferase